MKHAVVWVLLFLVGFGFQGIAAAEEPSGSQVQNTAPDYSDTLTGEWGGARSRMSARGYDWEIVYKLDLLNKLSAPGERTFGVDNLDVMLSLDGEKLAGLRGMTGLLYFLSNHGSKPSAQGDHSAGLDNIETPEGANTVKLYQAWIQQAFLDDQLSVLVGLYDLNSEFYATESSAIFLQPTYGIGAEMAGAGPMGPSVFPIASLAIRAKAELDGYYLQGVTLDGVPGDPDNLQGNHVQFNKGDGALNVLEAGMPLDTAENAHDNKLAFGVWRYTVRADDLLDPAVKRISRGYYVVADKVLRYKPGSDERSINSFVRAGKTDGDTYQLDMSWSAGLLFTGLIQGRDKDQLGIAYAEERNSTKFLADPANPQVSSEKSVELAYDFNVLPGLILKPSLQYLLNHSSDPAQDKSWWFSTRIQATF